MPQRQVERSPLMYSLQKDVGARLEERSHAGDVPCAGGLHKRRAELLSMVVRVGAMLEQQQQYLGVSLRKEGITSI